MKCKCFGCSKQAEGRFPCCGMNHGCRYKDDRSLAQAYLRGDLTGYGQSLIDSWPPDKLKYYLSLLASDTAPKN